MTKDNSQARHRQSREAALEEMSVQTSAKKVDREDADVTCCGRPFRMCFRRKKRKMHKTVHG